jgi:hypothetical protein
MNPEATDILDRALVYSLWVFLVSYVVILLVSRSRFRRRKRRLGDLYAEIAASDQRSRSVSLPLQLNPWRTAMNGLLLALFLASLFFIAYSFVPLPRTTNLVSSTAWQITPLRVTSLRFDRFHEGFSVEGEVWNQTADPVTGLRVAVEVVGTDGKPLDEVMAEVSPQPLPPGRPGIFQVRYAESSPFIRGYKLSFFDGEGENVPHLTGFDAP